LDFGGEDEAADESLTLAIFAEQSSPSKSPPREALLPIRRTPVDGEFLSRVLSTVALLIGPSSFASLSLPRARRTSSFRSSYAPRFTATFLLPPTSSVSSFRISTT
jgi:hypothetical protein